MKRKLIQAITTVATNAHITGFIEGTIYKGKLKNLCVPGLNCYSCPGALGSCPIGSLQAVAGTGKFSFSFYVVGLLLLFGLLLGRAVCGFLCPFGLIQELLHKIPLPKVKKPLRKARYTKYVILLVFVIIMPVFVTDKYGIGAPAFCQYICPAGTLTAGLPLLATNPDLAAQLGWLFWLKATILGAVVIGSVFIQRFFCKFMCPLGAIYALFNSFSLYRLRYDVQKCIHCGKCARVCPMDVDPTVKQDSTECIRCGDCVRACPVDALSSGWRTKQEGCAGCEKAQEN